MSNAFAPILRARPCPIFGRPVHPGSPPIDYSPILLLKPFGFRITPDTLSSSEISRWPARHYPRLWIQRPSSERRRDFNPPDSCAAQRTVWKSPDGAADCDLAPITLSDSAACVPTRPRRPIWLAPGMTSTAPECARWPSRHDGHCDISGHNWNIWISIRYSTRFMEPLTSRGGQLTEGRDEDAGSRQPSTGRQPQLGAFNGIQQPDNSCAERDAILAVWRPPAERVRATQLTPR